MYFCLPVGTLKRTTLPKNDPTFRVYHAIAVVPKDVTTSAQEAEYASMAVTKDLLNQRQKIGAIDIWPSRFLAHSASAVVRTFLIDKSDYVSSLEEKDFDGCTFSGDDKAALVAGLPERFWLSEITLPDLYCANKTKIIDFFYNCNQPPLNDSNEVFQRWLQVRFPYVLSKFNKSGNPSMTPMNIKSHYPLIRGKIGDSLEW
jgi:hypothetical protein